eukprot:3711295-Amphidinium_carterae.1
MSYVVCESAYTCFLWTVSCVCRQFAKKRGTICPTFIHEVTYLGRVQGLAEHRSREMQRIETFISVSLLLWQWYLLCLLQALLIKRTG